MADGSAELLIRRRKKRRAHTPHWNASLQRNLRDDRTSTVADYWSKSQCVCRLVTAMSCDVLVGAQILKFVDILLFPAHFQENISQNTLMTLRIQKHIMRQLTIVLCW